MPTTVASLFAFYGVFLILAGLTAFAMADFATKAKTAVIMGGGSGVVVLLVALLLIIKPLKGYRTIIAAIGQLIIAVYVFVFAWRALAILHSHEKEYLRNVLGVMCVVSAIFLGLIFPAAAKAAKAASSSNEHTETTKKTN